MLFGNKVKWSTDTSYDIDKPWKHYANWREPVTKDHTLGEMSRMGKSGDRKYVSGCWVLEKMGRLRRMAKQFGVSFQGHENILKLIVMMDIQLCEYTKSHWIIYFERVNCMASELYLNGPVQKRTPLCL